MENHLKVLTDLDRTAAGQAIPAGFIGEPADIGHLALFLASDEARCFLDEIAEAGYEWTELGPYGYLPTDLPTLRAELEKRNLKVAATFAMANLEDPNFPSPQSQMQNNGVNSSRVVPPDIDHHVVIRLLIKDRNGFDLTMTRSKLSLVG